MNFPNKLTMARIFMAVIVIVLLLFPYDQVGLEVVPYSIGNVIISIEYIIAENTTSLCGSNPARAFFVTGGVGNAEESKKTL